MKNNSLNPEDFIVTDERRAIWTVEMEISSVLLDFCEKNNLRIWASYGTLLGAVRHKGFIPWDDDMDFYMLREDYDKLYDLVKKGVNLRHPFEFDIVDGAIIRLTNVDTTLLNIRYKLDEKRNYGIWVDVMCLDKAPDVLTSEAIKEHEALRRRVRLINSGKNYAFKSFKGLRYKLSHLISKMYYGLNGCQKAIDHLMSDMRKVADKSSGKLLWNFTEQSKVLSTKKIQTYDSSWFSETVMLPFENMYLPCPKEFEQCLVAEFGENWRTPLIGSSWHEGAVFDVNTPYECFIKNRIQGLSKWDRFWWAR